METLSQKFLQALAPPRDAIYRLALLKSGTPGAAEAALQESARAVFRDFSGEKIRDIPAALEKSLSGVPAQTGAPPAAEQNPEAPGAVMPADVWARLSAAVQIEAASSADSRAINSDSVLLRPDPLLAPKKSKPREEEDFDLTSPSRLFTLLGAVLLVGVLVTVYIMTRPASRPPAAAPHAASRPGTP